jgi:hypothetical protein
MSDFYMVTRCGFQDVIHFSLYFGVTWLPEISIRAMTYKCVVHTFKFEVTNHLHGTPIEELIMCLQKPNLGAGFKFDI